MFWTTKIMDFFKFLKILSEKDINEKLDTLKTRIEIIPQVPHRSFKFYQKKQAAIIFKAGQEYFEEE